MFHVVHHDVDFIHVAANHDFLKKGEAMFNSLPQGNMAIIFSVILTHYTQNSSLGTDCEIDPQWMSQNFTNG